MSKAEELADCLEGDRYYDRDGLLNLISEAAAELRRLAALEQAAEPVAYVVAAQYEDGSHAGHRLEWRGRNEANDLPEGTALYTHPAPRKPMTDEQALAIVKAAPALDTAEQEWLHVIRQVERFHQIKGITMLTDEHLRDVLAKTNDMVRNAMHGPFWPELADACRAIEAEATAPLLARIAELEQAVRWEADLCQQALDSRAELESENKLLDSLMRSGEWRGVQKGLEEAASICEEKHANGNWKYDTRHECAEAIRAAMKEQP